MEHNTTAPTESDRPFRRQDDWTRYAFNPVRPGYGTALSEAIGRQNEYHRQNRSTSMTDGIRSVLRRLDRWTLTVFNPYYASDHR